MTTKPTGKTRVQKTIEHRIRLHKIEPLFKKNQRLHTCDLGLWCVGGGGMGAPTNRSNSKNAESISRELVRGVKHLANGEN